MLFTEPEGPSRWGRVVWALRCPMWLFAPTLRCPMWPTPVLECPGPVSMLGRLSICEWTDSCPQAATKFLSPMGAWGPASLDEWHSAAVAVALCLVYLPHCGSSWTAGPGRGDPREAEETLHWGTAGHLWTRLSDQSTPFPGLPGVGRGLREECPQSVWGLVPSVRPRWGGGSRAVLSPSSDICHLGWGWGRCTGYPTDHSYSLRGLWFCSGPTPFPMTLVGLGHMAPLVSEMGGAGLQWGWGVREVCPGLLGSSWKRSCWGPGQTPRPKRQGGQTAPGAHELEHSPCWGAAEFQGCLTHIGKLEVEGYIVCVSSAFFASHPPPPWWK